MPRIASFAEMVHDMGVERVIVGWIRRSIDRQWVGATDLCSQMDCQHVFALILR